MCLCLFRKKNKSNYHEIGSNNNCLKTVKKAVQNSVYLLTKCIGCCNSRVDKNIDGDFRVMRKELQLLENNLRK